jgi:hypothetical protein
MYNVQDYSVLYNNKLLVLLYDRFGFLLACGKHLHDRIISLRAEVLVHKTSLTFANCYWSACPKSGKYKFSLSPIHYITIRVEVLQGCNITLITRLQHYVNYIEMNISILMFLGIQFVWLFWYLLNIFRLSLFNYIC